VARAKGMLHTEMRAWMSECLSMRDGIYVSSHGVKQEGDYPGRHCHINVGRLPMQLQQSANHELQF